MMTPYLDREVFGTSHVDVYAGNILLSAQVETKTGKVSAEEQVI